MVTVNLERESDLGIYIVFGGIYASRRPQGLRKLVLAGTPASMPLYAKGCKYLLSQLPEDTRKIIEDCEEKKDYSSPDYQKATSVFYGRYFCRIDPLPEPIQIGFQHLQEDCVAYQTL